MESIAKKKKQRISLIMCHHFFYGRQNHTGKNPSSNCSHWILSVEDVNGYIYIWNNTSHIVRPTENQHLMRSIEISEVASMKVQLSNHVKMLILTSGKETFFEEFCFTSSMLWAKIIGIHWSDVFFVVWVNSLIFSRYYFLFIRYLLLLYLVGVVRSISFVYFCLRSFKNVKLLS